MKSGKGITISNNIVPNMKPSINNTITKSNEQINRALQNNTSTNNTTNNIVIPKPKDTAIKFSDKADEYWPQILNELKDNGKRVLFTSLEGTRLTQVNDMTVGIEFPNGMNPFGKTVLERQENIKEISTLVSMACGKPMQIKYISGNNSVHKVTNEENLKNLANESDIPFNVID